MKFDIPDSFSVVASTRNSNFIYRLALNAITDQLMLRRQSNRWCDTSKSELSGGDVAVAIIHTYMHTYMETYIQAYIHTYIHTYMYAYIHTYIHTYLHTYIHAYIHTCMHTYIHT